MKQNEQTTKLLENLNLICIEPINEIYQGIVKKTIPWLNCLIPGIVFNLIRLLDLDYYILKSSGLVFFYPVHFKTNLIYLAFAWSSGFIAWGFYRVSLKLKLVRKLTEIFKAANLKTPTGKLPSVIFDLPLDEWTRKLRLKRTNLPLQSFEASKPTLESGLQVFIDEIKENRAAGTVDIIYSHHEMPKQVILDKTIETPKDTYFVGETRARKIECNLNDSPHLLIGGQTGGGKSTFLRQLITTLYIKNPTYNFILIDLKAGLEFQIFENLKRAKIVSNAETTMGQLKKLESMLNYRLAALKENKTKDISDYLKLPKEKIVDTSKLPNSAPMVRTITVIDEAAELFLAGELAKTKDVQEAKRIVQRLAAQGRAAGMHLIIATQKPDAKAVDTHIKTNLTSIISFQMPNLGSSMSILSNGRAADLPKVPGRAIWKMGLDLVEVQTPFLSYDSAVLILDEQREYEKNPSK